MDVLMLSRLQFAAATFFHFLFVPLTLGLSILIAIMETIYVRTGDDEYRRMAKFWGKIFLVNFAVGIVTGITLEFQFGTNWSRYSRYVGDIFGSLLAIEATLAFFLESTFLAVWVFGWKRLSPRLHCVCIWLVALASNLSALWIIIANAWMQHPVGFVLRNGRAEMNDFMAVITQPFAIQQFFHTVSGAYILAGFVVMGISAYHLLRRQHPDLFHQVLPPGPGVRPDLLGGRGRPGAHPRRRGGQDSAHQTCGHGIPLGHPGRGAVCGCSDPGPGPRTESGGVRPHPRRLEYAGLPLPDGRHQGAEGFPKDERPPVALTFISFRLMVGLGFLFVLLTVVGWLSAANWSPAQDT